MLLNSSLIVQLEGAAPTPIQLLYKKIGVNKILDIRIKGYIAVYVYDIVYIVNT